MTAREVDLARRTGVEIHLLDLPSPPEIAFWDFSQADRLIADGRQAARSWLEATPLRFRVAWQSTARVWVAGIGRRLERLASG
jgi:hypothetical protein